MTLVTNGINNRLKFEEKNNFRFIIRKKYYILHLLFSHCSFNPSEMASIKSKQNVYRLVAMITGREEKYSE